jgi:hypothetical protein
MARVSAHFVRTPAESVHPMRQTLLTPGALGLRDSFW